VQCPVEDTGGQIFGIMDVASTIVDVVEYPFYVPFVQDAKGLLVTLRGTRQGLFFFGIRHSFHLTGKAMNN